MSTSVPALIPREVLFGNPDRAAPLLSPDGKWLSYLAPHQGVLNLWIAPADDPTKATRVTNDNSGGIHFYRWAYTNRHILYVQDKDGDESYNVWCLDVANQAGTNLTRMTNVQARVVGVSPRTPDEIVVTLNDRDPQLHDLYRINLLTGARALLLENPGYVGFVLDDRFNVRLALNLTLDGGKTLFRPNAQGAWESFIDISSTDALTSSPVEFDATGQFLYLTDSRNRDTAALVRLHLATGALETLAENARADVCGVLLHPTARAVQAVAWNYELVQWQAFEPLLAADFERLAEVADGTMEIVSRTLDDQHWLVAYLRDDGPLHYYRYDRPTKQATFLFTNRSELADVPLAKMRPVTIAARDGLPLVCYYTLPSWVDLTGPSESPLPLVLLVHGGPWSRDVWGLNPLHQLLANRGYAVLSVNFRGSTGFGKTFINAGDREWGGKMQDDLLDAVAWAVAAGLAAPKRVAIMGSSYGGYAALCGLTFTPDVFACGVDMFGPSSLVTFLSSIPPSWHSLRALFATRVGEHETEAGRALLDARSPLAHVKRITKPLLIAQGANDPRVRQEESDQIVAALHDTGVPVTYVLYPDEGHGFSLPANSLSFIAVAEAFLAKHIGGRAEPIAAACAGSSISVPVGGAHVPGLVEAVTVG